MIRKLAVFFMLTIFCASLSSAQTVWNGVSSRQIALTFDDGPTPGVTDKILKILETEKVKATFFVIGRKVEQNPDLLRRISENGHDIGNHTYSHSRMSWINDNKLLKETQQTSDLIENIAGRPSFLFRPPHGKINYNKRKLLEKEGYHVVLWSVSADDCYRKGRGIREPSSIVRRVVSRVRGGDIVLLHDNSKQIVEALPRIIKALKGKGYALVKVSELMRYTSQKQASHRPAGRYALEKQN